jgi:predicted CopG family antitoxin
MPRITRTIKVDLDIWKNAKKLAIDENTNLSQLIEELLNKELKKKVKG